MDNVPNIKPGQQDERAKALWPAILSLSVGVFGLVTAEFLPASLLTPISHELGVSLGAAGQAVTMTSIVAAFAGPMVVVGTAKLDRRIALIVLTTLLMLSSVVAGLANNLFVLLLSRFLLGIGLGGFWALAVALAMRLVPAHQVARAVAVIMTGVSVATVCAAPIGAWVGATIGWRYAFFMAAAVGAAALLMQILSAVAASERCRQLQDTGCRPSPPGHSAVLRLSVPDSKRPLRGLHLHQGVSGRHPPL